MASKGGYRKGAGRKPGSVNAKTKDRIEAFKASGKKDPFDSTIELHEWALREFKRACAALAAFEKEHTKVLKRVATDADPTKADMRIKIAHTELVGNVDKFSSKIQSYAASAMPFLHAKLTSTEMTAEVFNHEAALDDLDD